jgi:vacuolar-type H+-ATPase subunit I/STV1
MTKLMLPPDLAEREQQLIDGIESKKAAVKRMKVEVRQDEAALAELRATVETFINDGWTPAKKIPNRPRRAMQQIVLDYVTENPGSTIEQMAAVLDATTTQIRTVLRGWAEQGKVLRSVDGAAELWTTGDAAAVVEGPLFREQTE